MIPKNKKGFVNIEHPLSLPSLSLSYSHTQTCTAPPHHPDSLFIIYYLLNIPNDTKPHTYKIFAFSFFVTTLSLSSTFSHSVMCDEDWINVAMSDDSVVVELLLRLHQATPPQPPPTKNQPPCLDIDWTVRQRRSRSVPRHRGSEGKDETTRASPTTPLSWSCATSASCGGGGGGVSVDGCEESSRPIKLVESSRSKKVTNPNETTSAKRSRRKKTLVELKEEENLLLKERKNLKSELASLRLSVEKHRAANKSLKRMKLDLESGKAFKTDAASVATEEEQSHSYNAISSTSITNKVLNDAPLICPTNSIKAQETSKQEASFLLPDLNLPVEEDLSSNALT